MERGATEIENKMVGSMLSLYKDTYYLELKVTAVRWFH